MILIFILLIIVLFINITAVLSLLVPFLNTVKCLHVNQFQLNTKLYTVYSY